MKTKNHLLKNKIRVQLTDGSIFELSIFSEANIVKLSIDPRSHTLWKTSLINNIQKNYMTAFMKKFNFFHN